MLVKTRGLSTDTDYIIDGLSLIVVLLGISALFRLVLKADPQFAPAWYNIADLLDDGGRSHEAIACLKCAIDIDPAYAGASEKPAGWGGVKLDVSGPHGVAGRGCRAGAALAIRRRS
jgi:tetratricopeptide (TPR) repeat protein